MKNNSRKLALTMVSKGVNSVLPGETAFLFAKRKLNVPPPTLFSSLPLRRLLRGIVGADANGFPPPNQINRRAPPLPPPLLRGPEPYPPSPPPPRSWRRLGLPPGTRPRWPPCGGRTMVPSRPADAVVLFPGYGGGGADDRGRAHGGLDRGEGVDDPPRGRERLAQPRRRRRAVRQAHQEAAQGTIFCEVLCTSHVPQAKLVMFLALLGPWYASECLVPLGHINEHLVCVVWHMSLCASMYLCARSIMLLINLFRFS